jgi:hypothetical protein
MTPLTPLGTTRPPDLAIGVWDIDPSHSNVEFVARHLFSRVRGRFGQFSGVVHVADSPADCSVAVTVEAASIDTGHADRDQHLRGADFLDVDQFPTLTFTSTSVSAVAEDAAPRSRDCSRSATSPAPSSSTSSTSAPAVTPGAGSEPGSRPAPRSIATTSVPVGTSCSKPAAC